MAVQWSLGEVMLIFGSGLYNDEEFFETGKTYVATLTIPPGLGKEGVALMIGPTHCGFIKESTFDFAKSYLHHGFTVKVGVTQRSGLSDPKYSKNLDIWQRWGTGKGECWAEAESMNDFARSIKVDLGQLKIDFGTGEFRPEAEACFIAGSTYRLVKSEVQPGKVGVAKELDKEAKHYGWVTTATAKKALSALEHIKTRSTSPAVYIRVTQVEQGRQGEWDAKLNTKRDWWHGVADCWFNEIPCFGVN